MAGATFCHCPNAFHQLANELPTQDLALARFLFGRLLSIRFRRLRSRGVLRFGFRFELFLFLALRLSLLIAVGLSHETSLARRLATSRSFSEGYIGSTCYIPARMNSIGVRELDSTVSEVLETTPFIDIHTHLFAPGFGKIGLWGIDELLTYHYLEAELFRSTSIHPTKYWTLSKTQRADLVWKTLFVENAPVSEAARGVIAVLQALGLDANTRSLGPLREFFQNQKLDDYIPRVFKLAGIREAVMTNDPLDPDEAAIWNAGVEFLDLRFRAALRIDRILNEWDMHWNVMASQGYCRSAGL